MFYLKIVPESAVIYIRNDGGCDGVLAYHNLLHSEIYTYVEAITFLNKLNWCTFHPDLGFRIHYEGKDVMSVLSDQGLVIGMAVDDCQPEWTPEHEAIKYLADVHDAINEMAIEYGCDAYVIYKDEDLQAVIMTQDDQVLEEVHYGQIPE